MNDPWNDLVRVSFDRLIPVPKSNPITHPERQKIDAKFQNVWEKIEKMRTKINLRLTKQQLPNAILLVL